MRDRDEKAILSSAALPLENDGSPSTADEASPVVAGKPFDLVSKSDDFGCGFTLLGIPIQTWQRLNAEEPGHKIIIRSAVFDWDFRGVELAGIMFQACSFLGTWFDRCTFNDIRFERCTMQDVDFMACSLGDLSITDGRLAETSVIDCSAGRVQIRGAALDRVSIKNTRLDVLEFSGCDLCSTSMSDSQVGSLTIREREG